MKNLEKRLVLFLANPDLSNSEFSDLAQIMSSPRIRMILEAAWQVRKQLDRELGQDRAPYEETIQQRVVSEVTRLLLHEAGLQKGEAIRMLAQKLEYPKELPPRFSFDGAVLLFIRHFDGSHVVSAAQQLRNKLVHDRPSHSWPLGGGV